MHCSGPQDAQSRKPRPTDHVSPQQGPEGPLGMWVAIFASCCQVILFFYSWGRNRLGMGAKHWYSQSPNAKLSCQPELNCIMRVSVTFVKLRDVRGKGDSLACHATCTGTHPFLLPLFVPLPTAERKKQSLLHLPKQITKSASFEKGLKKDIKL